MATKVEKKRLTWCGPAPATCDLCGRSITSAFVDGKTTRGLWGNMCSICHALHGVGLGVGRGQRYERDEVDGRYVKVAG